MTPLPTPSRRVLTELSTLYLTEHAGSGQSTSTVRRAFVALTTLLDAQAAALAELDRIEADLVARHGFPRVALPVRPGTPPAHAADATTIRRHLGAGPAARRLTAALRRQKRRFVRAADAAGQPAAQAHARDLADQIGDTTASLLIALASDPVDLTVKITVMIAMSEPGAADATTFPSAYLRTLLVDIIELRRSTGPIF